MIPTLSQNGKSELKVIPNILQMCEKIIDKKTHLHFNVCPKMSKTGNIVSSRKRHVVLVAPCAPRMCGATATATAPVA